MLTQDVVSSKKFTVTLVTLRKKRSNDARLNDQVTRAIQNGMEKHGRSRSWSMTTGNVKIQEEKCSGDHSYKYSCVLEFDSSAVDGIDVQWGRILRDMMNVPGNGNWFVESSTNEAHVVDQFVTRFAPMSGQPQTKEDSLNTSNVVVEEEEHAEPDYSQDPHFNKLFDRGHQISIGVSATDAAVESKFETRLHTVFYGPPACGKTAIMDAMKTKYKEMGVHCIGLDGTSLTHAGLIQLFMGAAATETDAKSTTVEKLEAVQDAFDNDEEQPLSAADTFVSSTELPTQGILFIEEIEKGDEKPLRLLLGLMNESGIIQQTNFHGNREKKVEYVVMCTVNDKAHFDKLLKGALSSRFANKVYCPVPTRSCLEKILHRDVTAKNGNVEWIKPALDYCLDVEQTTNSRRALAVCLGGRDKLLTGDYQRSLKAVRRSMRKDGLSTDK